MYDVCQQDGEAKSFDAILKESQLGAYDMLVQEAFGTLSYPGAGGTLRSSLYPQAVPFILTSDNCFENVEADENFRCPTCRDGKYTLYRDCHDKPGVWCAPDGIHFLR